MVTRVPYRLGIGNGRTTCQVGSQHLEINSPLAPGSDSHRRAAGARSSGYLGQPVWPTCSRLAMQKLSFAGAMSAEGRPIPCGISNMAAGGSPGVKCAYTPRADVKMVNRCMPQKSWGLGPNVANNVRLVHRKHEKAKQFVIEETRNAFQQNQQHSRTGGARPKPECSLNSVKRGLGRIQKALVLSCSKQAEAAHLISRGYGRFVRKERLSKTCKTRSLQFFRWKARPRPSEAECAAYDRSDESHSRVCGFRLLPSHSAMLRFFAWMTANCSSDFFLRMHDLLPDLSGAFRGAFADLRRTLRCPHTDIFAGAARSLAEISGGGDGV